MLGLFILTCRPLPPPSTITQSTLAKSVFDALGGEANVTYLVHDSYYKGRLEFRGDGHSYARPCCVRQPMMTLSITITIASTTDMTHKTFEERASTNFDHPDSLDTSLLVQHIRQLKKGETVEIPTYDFATHLRTDVTEQRVPRKIILVEGILIFTEPELVQELDMKVFVVRDSRVCMDLLQVARLILFLTAQHLLDYKGCRLGHSTSTSYYSRYSRTRENCRRGN